MRHRDLPRDTPIEALADYFAAIMSGMAVLAKVGVPESRLLAAIEHALCALPDADEGV